MAGEAIPDADDATVKRAWVWAKVIGIIGGALIGLLAPAYTAYHLAAGEARAAAAKVKDSTVDLAVQTKADSQATKNEAEAGYQVLLKEVESLRADKAARERAKPRKHRAKTPTPKALPQDLKKAEQAVSSASTSPPAVAATPSAIAGDAHSGRADAGP